ncbi:MAG: CoA pyrophosphatase [Kordiimonas sp.]|nr:CoA pyrophosphatase [Kordiimonas sp.]
MQKALSPAGKRSWLRPDYSDYDLYQNRQDYPRTDLPLKPAAVLVPLVERQAGLTVLLTQRASHLNKHAGQISFPGGRSDAQDRNAMETALRETKEEIGIERQLIDIAGAMDDYETVTGFTVTPVIGFVQPTFELEIDRNEVDDAFEVPLDFLMDPGNHQLQSRIHKGHERHFYAVPYENRYIWGATAAMLVRFSQLITKA